MDKLKKVVEFVKASFADKEARKVLAIVLAVLFLVFIASQAKAKAVASLQDNQGIVITLFDDPCKLTKHVTNLPYRATWTENGKTSEGCAGVRGPVVVLFFESDKTVGVIPSQAFSPVSGV